MKRTSTEKRRKAKKEKKTSMRLKVKRERVMKVIALCGKISFDFKSLSDSSKNIVRDMNE